MSAHMRFHHLLVPYSTSILAFNQNSLCARTESQAQLRVGVHGPSPTKWKNGFRVSGVVWCKGGTSSLPSSRVHVTTSSQPGTTTTSRVSSDSPLASNSSRTLRNSKYACASFSYGHLLTRDGLIFIAFSLTRRRRTPTSPRPSQRSS